MEEEHKEAFESHEEREEASIMQRVLLSQTLTFPLTLARYAHVFHSTEMPIMDHDKDDATTGTSTLPSSPSSSLSIRIACVGARAEATLSTEFWMEFLIARHWFQQLDRKGESMAEPMVPIDYHIDFIGPDVIVPPKSSSSSSSTTTTSNSSIASIAWKDKRTNTTFEDSLSLSFHRTYLHSFLLDQYKKNSTVKEDDDKSDLLNQWHGFLLFNPGCGHPNLLSSWKPSLGFMNKAQRPLIVTAHSSLDAQRDLEIWNNYFSKSGEGGLRREEEHHQDNPWASRMMYRDPIEVEREHHWVRPNHSVLVL